MRTDDFRDADWARIARDWTAWWDGALDRPLVLVKARDPGHPPGDAHNNLVRFGLETPVDAILDHYEPHFATTHYFGDAFPQWWLNAGPGIMAAYLGSKPHFASNGGWGTTWFEPVEVDSLDDLHLTFDPEDRWWQHTQAVMTAAVARWGDRLVIGQTDLGGNLDILASLRGTQPLLFDLHDNPAAVERLAGEITALWLRYYDALQAIASAGRRGVSYWSAYWSPGTGYILQSDFCYMISPAMFERFVLPDLTACCAHLQYPFYHLDGKGQLPHLERILQIPNLRGVQWQPGDGQPRADGWLDVLRTIRAAGKLCQVYVTREGARRILDALGGVGFQFQIIEDGLTPEEAAAFVESL